MVKYYYEHGAVPGEIPIRGLRLDNGETEEDKGGGGLGITTTGGSDGGDGI